MDRPRLIETDPAHTDWVDPAVKLLHRGGLVAFPTETVYGLGADAGDAEAVERIFRAKDRPAGHPLIVHVDDADRARAAAAGWPDRAAALADAFWPGPLTLIVERGEAVVPEATGGLPTVGLRCPAHPVARTLVRAAEVPVAAPSANVHQGVSPTRAEHVVRSLDGAVDLVLDGGPTDVGIESTVLSLTERRPTILRPGMLGREDLEAVVGEVELADDVDLDRQRARPSPGMGERHYAPGASVVLEPPQRAEADETVGETGWILCGDTTSAAGEAARVRELPCRVEAYARDLYDALHELDRHCDRIVVEPPPREPRWRAVWNRLRRAAR